MKKIFLFFIILLSTFTTSIISFADDENIENYNISSDFFQNISTSSNDISLVPQINARHAIIFDRNSCQTIYGKKENELCKMASTTKIMTAIIVLENGNLNDIVKISSKSAHTGGSRLGLSTNDSITVENLLYGLMMKSGNDAAVALAEHIGGSIENFAIIMNKKAKELNLQSTNYVTPHGLDDDNHYTTAYDLACLTDYALKNKTFSKIVKTKNYTITINNYSKTLSNTNELLGNYEGIYGVKTGFTNGANRCLVTACKKDNLDIICVVLGCDTKKDRTQDSIKLLNYTFNNFVSTNIQDIIYDDFNTWNNLHKNSFTINKGISNTLELSLKETDFKFKNIAINKSDLDKINTKITFNSYFEAPLSINQKIGNIELIINDKKYFSINIINNNEIKKKKTLTYITYIFKNYCILFSNFYYN